MRLAFLLSLAFAALSALALSRHRYAHRAVAAGLGAMLVADVARYACAWPLPVASALYAVMPIASAAMAGAIFYGRSIGKRLIIASCIAGALAVVGRIVAGPAVWLPLRLASAVIQAACVASWVRRVASGERRPDVTSGVALALVATDVASLAFGAWIADVGRWWWVSQAITATGLSAVVVAQIGALRGAVR